jgi:hypothetical protein
MNKYYVNSFYGGRIGLPRVYPNMYIGLFRECKAKGEGNFCGYYGAEYYLDTELIAYYEAEGGSYQPEKRIGKTHICGYKFDEFLIGSHMWTQVIEAEDDAEARDKFIRAEWRQWNTFKDEPRTVKDVIEDAINDRRFTSVIINIADGDKIYNYYDDNINMIDSAIMDRYVKDLIIRCYVSPRVRELDIKI